MRMKEQLYWEDVREGEEIHPLFKFPSTRQLVMWAGASEDYYELHYDKNFAAKTGFPEVILPGGLKAAFLSQMLTDWIGKGGWLRKLSCEYEKVDYPGQELICRGKVRRKRVEEEEHLVECEVWVENRQGEVTTSGSALVILPFKEY